MTDQQPRLAEPMAPHVTTAVGERMPQLDGLRTLAVLAVLYQHTGTGYLQRLGYHGIGGYGVWLFFVLSGFLITRILLRARTTYAGDTGTALRVFYIRRALRIFPAYYVALAIAMLVGIHGTRELAGWYLSYLFNIHAAVVGDWPQGGVPVHIWSLCVEEQFYLAWPLLMLVVRREWLPKVIGAAIILGPITRAVLWLLTHSAVTVYAFPLSSLDCLGLGALLGWAWTTHGAASALCRDWVRRAGVAGFALLLVTWILVVADRAIPIRQVIHPLAVGLSAVWLVHSAATGFRGLVGRVLQSSPFVSLGRISYGFYLYHNFVRWFIAEHWPMPTGLAQFLVVGSISLVISIISWHVVEKPFNSLKDRFAYEARPDRIAVDGRVLDDGAGRHAAPAS